jgi:heme/copper-type cytochrome/quinol oxidase subunit 4
MCLLEIYYLLHLGFNFLFLRSLMCGSLNFMCILCVLKVWCVVQYVFQESNVCFNLLVLCVYILFMFQIPSLLILFMDVTLKPYGRWNIERIS